MDNFYALVVGVGDADIPETVKDAEAIKEVLTNYGAYKNSNTFFLTKEESTKDAIINAFDEIIKRSSKTPDATVFIYYSGHGARFYNQTTNEFDYYLISHGADYSNKENTMVNGDLFSEKIENIKAERVLVMLDCCHAGGIKTEGLKLKTKGETEPEYSNRALQEKLKSGEGRVFISSCDDNETSVILPDAENSLFTEVALEILNGFFSKGREYVSALDLIYHVLNEVPVRIQPFNHNQNPILTEAKNLNHKYFVCKNGEYQTYPEALSDDYSVEKSFKKLDLDTIVTNEESVSFNFHDLSKIQQEDVNGLFEQIHLETNVDEQFKIDFVKDIGGLDNLKKLNTKINDFSDKEIKIIGDIITSKNLLEAIEIKHDQESKIKFINNYKNKI